MKAILNLSTAAGVPPRHAAASPAPGAATAAVESLSGGKTIPVVFMPSPAGSKPLLVSGAEMLAMVFSAENRPSLRWLAEQQEQRTLPFKKMGRLCGRPISSRQFLFVP
jgi:hypothetical protein